MVSVKKEKVFCPITRLINNSCDLERNSHNNRQINSSLQHLTRRVRARALKACAPISRAIFLGKHGKKPLSRKRSERILRRS